MLTVGPAAAGGGVGLADSIAPGLEQVIEAAAVAIEVLAVTIIVGATSAATIQYVRRLVSHTAGLPAYEQYKIRLGRALLLGLEILVAADVVRTVALEPSLTNVGILAVLVLIRTFLSWSLVVEIEHRWPWQPRRSELASAEGPGASVVGGSDAPS